MSLKLALKQNCKIHNKQMDLKDFYNNGAVFTD